MLNSSLRKRALSGWLYHNSIEEFYCPLKLQKFLFFYESYSNIENGLSEFQSLKGYKNGPVFSDVYGDYTHEKDEFIADSRRVFSEIPDIVDEERANFSNFLVKILTEDELSKITHEMNIWKAKQSAIETNAKNVSLHISDLNESDVELLKSLRNMYSNDFINSVRVLNISTKSFLIRKEDERKLTSEQKNVFTLLAEDETLDNPVYISIDEDGVILVD